MRLISFSASCLLLIINSTAFASMSAKQLLDKVDQLYRSTGSISEVEMQIQTPDWERTMRMKMWTKGLDYTFVRILSPKKDKGVSSLKRNKEMWNFFPKINKVIKVPPSMMMGSWMGSDFTNDDLVKDSSMADDYNSTLQEQNDIYLIHLTPKPNTVSLWGKISVSIDKKTLLPTKQEFYDEKGELIRIMTFSDVKKLGNKTLPTKMELRPQIKSKIGHKTIVRYISAQFDVDVPMSTFTRTNLQKRR